MTEVRQQLWLSVDESVWRRRRPAPLGLPPSRPCVCCCLKDPLGFPRSWSSVSCGLHTREELGFHFRVSVRERAGPGWPRGPQLSGGVRASVTVHLVQSS